VLDRSCGEDVEELQSLSERCTSWLDSTWSIRCLLALIVWNSSLDAYSRFSYENPNIPRKILGKKHLKSGVFNALVKNTQTKSGGIKQITA